MLGRFDYLAARIERETPDDRDRYLDLLRVLAILVVVLGHWLARVVIAPDGEPTGRQLLSVAPATRWATWVVQVMPLFFIVGGALNLRSWRRAQAAGTGGVEWVRHRARRLLRPLVPLLWLWVGVSAFLAETGRIGAMLFRPEAAIVPVWFLAAYLVVTALTPVLADRGHVRVLAACVVAAATVDALRFAQPPWLAGTPVVDGVPLYAVLNYVFVWTAVHQLGYLWADGRVPRRRTAQWAQASAAVSVLGLLVGVAGYPIAMVAGGPTDNDAPPTIALFVLGLAQLGIALALRPTAERWLQRTRAWGAVGMLGSRLMTVFLWHQTAMLVVAEALRATHPWPIAREVGWQWVATRPLWITACLVVLVPLVGLFGRFERTDPAPATRLPSPIAVAMTALAVLATSASLGWLIVGGLASPEAPLSLPIVPVVGVIAGMGGLAVFSRATTAEGPEHRS